MKRSAAWKKEERGKERKRRQNSEREIEKMRAVTAEKACEKRQKISDL